MKTLRIIIIALIVLALGAFFWITAGSEPETLLLDRLQSGDQGLVPMVLIICALTLLSTLAGLPVFYLALALGFLLDFAPAFLIAMGVNLLGVMGAWYMVRYIFTSSFQEKYGKKKLIRRINKRIEKHGMWPVVFSRSIYVIPTNLINFSFPLSRITTRQYFLGTLLGLIPECLINVLSGYLIKHEVILLSSPDARTWQIVVVGAFILLFAAALILVRVLKRKKKFKKLKVVPYEGA